VWDGDRILAEDRQSSPSSAQTTGTVAYVHGPGLDQPLELLDSRSGQDGRVPNVNWRGLGESSSWTTGAPADCSLTGGSCTTINWPAGQGVYFEKPQSQSWPPPATWVGSLVANGEDGTSLLYRRNRFYDPASGQFTQQDPIGLGGGLNVYGFGAGDPVNFGDPFGLSCEGLWKDELAALLGAITAAVGDGEEYWITVRPNGALKGVPDKKRYVNFANWTVTRVNFETGEISIRRVTNGIAEFRPGAVIGEGRVYEVIVKGKLDNGTFIYGRGDVWISKATGGTGLIPGLIETWGEAPFPPPGAGDVQWIPLTP